MRIAVAGASRQAGSEIIKELSRRGHAVTAIARNPERIAGLPNVTPASGDVLDQAGLTRLWTGHDAAVSSIHFLASDPAKLIAAAPGFAGGPLPWLEAPVVLRSPPVSGWSQRPLSGAIQVRG
jgi:uncharacterized protein